MHLYKDATDTGTGPSAAIWGNCRVDDMINDPSKGVYFFEDFTGGLLLAANQAEANLGSMLAYTGSTAASYIIAADMLGGGVTLESTTDNEGAALRTLPAFRIGSGQGKLWFECRFKQLNITDSKFNVFVGLFEDEVLSTSSPITVSDAMADKNFVGFQRVFADGDALDSTYKADGQTQATVTADAIVTVADTFVKVGMYFDGTSLYFFKDGAELTGYATAANIAAATFPNDVNLGFCLGLMLGHGDAASVTIDWVRIAQERVS